MVRSIPQLLVQQFRFQALAYSLARYISLHARYFTTLTRESFEPVRQASPPRCPLGFIILLKFQQYNRIKYEVRSAQEGNPKCE